MTADQRWRLLVRRLVKAGIDRSEAEAWHVRDDPNRPGRYFFAHPCIRGAYTGLTRAKLAHLAHAGSMPGLAEAPGRARAIADGPRNALAAARALPGRAPVARPLVDGTRNHIVFPAGSPRAVDLLRRSRWDGVVVTPKASEAIASSLHATLDVVCVASGAPGFTIDPPESAWTGRTLQHAHGYLRVDRDCVVLARDCRQVLAVFITGKALPAVAQAAGSLPALQQTLGASMWAQKNRPGLTMFGVRWNRHERVENARVSYYAAKSLPAADSLYNSPSTKAAVLGTATAMCSAEREVAPTMAAHRAAHGLRSGHPGIWPGSGVTPQCPVPALGISRGYVSPPHCDKGFMHMAETIVWSTRGVKPQAEYCFAVTDAGVLFDLCADEAVMCMVPGTVRHGTPRTRKGFADQPGTGAVIISKANLLTSDAQADMATLRRALPSCRTNPLVGEFARTLKAGGMQ